MKLRAVSGTGGKEPACFLVEADGRRLLLDLGQGPIPGLLPNVSALGPVDAVLLSHCHGDHAGALHLRPKIGDPPVYASAAAAAQLPPDLAVRPLPLQGRAEVLGLPITTGRNGHAPGGIWIHLGIGLGLLYTGDYTTDSLLYAFDPPPAAGAAIIDASYGTDETALAARVPAIETALDQKATLLPVPPTGRGPEIALHLVATGRPFPALDSAMRNALELLLGPARDSLRPEAMPILERLRGAPAPSRPTGTILAGDAQCARGTSAELARRWRDDVEPAILFTGFVAPGTPADALMKAGRARYLRWNVHPRLSDNIRLIRDGGARMVVPAFAGPVHLAAWRDAFAPAEVTLAVEGVTL